MYQHPIFTAVLWGLLVNPAKPDEGKSSILGHCFISAVTTFPLEGIAMIAVAVSQYVVNLNR
jgi:hypothetical protein